MARQSATATRTTRVPLDRASIVDAAVLLAADGGQDAVSFRKLGASLGVDPTAIYRHFRDKDELVLAVIDHLLVDVVAAARTPKSWRDRLQVSARRTVETMAEHPGIGVEVGTRSTGGPVERDAIELVLQSLTDAGLSGEDVIRFYGMFTGFVLNFASGAAAGRLSRSDENEVSLWVGPLSRVNAQRHPQVAKYASELTRLTDDEVFEAGLKVILDAAEAAGRNRRRRTTPTKGSEVS